MVSVGDICGVAPSEGDDDEPKDHEGDEEADDHYENGRVTLILRFLIAKIYIRLKKSYI